MSWEENVMSPAKNIISGKVFFSILSVPGCLIITSISVRYSYAWSSVYLSTCSWHAWSTLSTGQVCDIFTSASYIAIVLTRLISPADIIASRRKLICDICTTNLDRPVMIEYGPQWEAHIRSRGHRRLAQRNTANNTNDGNTYTRPAGKSHNRSQIV